MSIRLRVFQCLDSASYAWSKLTPKHRRQRISFLPVLHIEQLDNERNFRGLLEYCQGYSRITGKRVVATVMTPLSPILRERLRASGFDAEAYCDRISSLSEHAIIGLHGHFIRHPPGSGRRHEVWPMHASFFDAEVIREQIGAEMDWLVSRNLMDPDRKIYSAGWWFMNQIIRDLLHDLGFRHDYSVASSPYCYSQAAWAERKAHGSFGRIIRAGTSPFLLGATALCSTAYPMRPKACFRRLVRDRSLAWRRSGEATYLTFYGHDFDLAPAEAIEATRLLRSCGYSFFEPADIEAAN